MRKSIWHSVTFSQHLSHQLGVARCSSSERKGGNKQSKTLKSNKGNSALIRKTLDWLPAGSSWNGWFVRKTQSNILDQLPISNRIHSPSSQMVKNGHVLLSRCLKFHNFMSEFFFYFTTTSILLLNSDSAFTIITIILIVFSVCCLMLWQWRGHRMTTNNINISLFACLFVFQLKCTKS